MIRRPPRSPLFPYTPLFRSVVQRLHQHGDARRRDRRRDLPTLRRTGEDQLELELLGEPQGGLDVAPPIGISDRSEEHTSELQSQSNLVCRLLLEKKKKELHMKTTRLNSSDSQPSYAVFCMKKNNNSRPCITRIRTRNYARS